MNCHESSPFDDRFLSRIRDRFTHVDSDPISGKRIYFESAGGSLTLKKVVETVTKHTALPDNAGRDNATSREIERSISQGKEDIKTLLGARSGVVSVGESTTSNAFKILSSIICHVSGDNVVTTNLDHPAIFDSTKILSERLGKQWRVAGLSPQSGLVEPQSVLPLIDSGTIVLALIHSSNITGTKNPVQSIIREARKIKPDLHILIDGAQHVPHCSVDVENLGCDIYLASSYKTFSKIGASAMYLSDRVAQMPHHRILGKPDDYWELGTREQAGYAAWSEVVNYLCWLGSHFTKNTARREQLVVAMEAIELHERTLTHRMLNGTADIPGLLDICGVTVYAKTDDLTVKEPLIIFNARGMKSDELVSYLGENGIRVHNRIFDAYSRHTLAALGLRECVRVSLAHYNTPEEVDLFLKPLQREVK